MWFLAVNESRIRMTDVLGSSCQAAQGSDLGLNITTRLDHVSHCSTKSGIEWSDTWTGAEYENDCRTASVTKWSSRWTGTEYEDDRGLRLVLSSSGGFRPKPVESLGGWGVGFRVSRIRMIDVSGLS